VAQAAASLHLNRFEVARCSVQLSDPDADPHVSLFPDNFTESRLGRWSNATGDPRLPSHFVRETAINTVACFIQVAVDSAAFVSGINASEVAEIRARAANVDCDPFKEDCGLKNAAATALVATIVAGCILLAIALALLIACIVQSCKLKSARKAAATRSPDQPGKKTQ